MGQAHKGQICLLCFLTNERGANLDANVVLVPLPGAANTSASDARVHAGFAIAYTSVRRMVSEIVAEQLEAHPGYRVVFTGECVRQGDENRNTDMFQVIRWAVRLLRWPAWISRRT